MKNGCSLLVLFPLALVATSYLISSTSAQDDSCRFGEGGTFKVECNNQNPSTKMGAGKLSVGVCGASACNTCCKSKNPSDCPANPSRREVCVTPAGNHLYLYAPWYCFARATTETDPQNGTIHHCDQGCGI